MQPVVLLAVGAEAHERQARHHPPHAVALLFAEDLELPQDAVERDHRRDVEVRRDRFELAPQRPAQVRRPRDAEHEPLDLATLKDWVRVLEGEEVTSGDLSLDPAGHYVLKAFSESHRYHVFPGPEGLVIERESVGATPQV